MVGSRPFRKVDLQAALLPKSNCEFEHEKALPACSKKMCRLQKFCFCASLRSGAIVGAVLNALIVASLASLSAVYFSEASVFARHENNDKERDRLIKGSIKAVQAIVAFVVLVFLCVGINRGIAGFVLPWLIVSVILILIGVINTVIFLSVGHWILAAVWVAVYGFWIYLFIVVLSYYKSLKEQTLAAETPIPLTQPIYTPPASSVPAAGADYSPMAPIDSKTGVAPLYPSFPAEATYAPQQQQSPNNASHNLYSAQVQKYGPPPTYSNV